MFVTLSKLNWIIILIYHHKLHKFDLSYIFAPHLTAVEIIKKNVGSKIPAFSQTSVKATDVKPYLLWKEVINRLMKYSANYHIL